MEYYLKLSLELAEKMNGKNHQNNWKILKLMCDYYFEY